MVRELSTLAVKPSDFAVRDNLWESPFKNFEMETIARNIILISKREGDAWKPFSWNQYKQKSQHEVSNAELSILLKLSDNGVLNYDGDKFSVNDKFITTLQKFIR
ncbi:MAG: hypothetical protein PHG66_05325 [Candidatus Colwellbacteria bacterium]|nr:hypothetical protein [Candidatus Colwellbacteria bacterium]